MTQHIKHSAVLKELRIFIISCYDTPTRFWQVNCKYKMTLQECINVVTVIIVSFYVDKYAKNGFDKSTSIKALQTHSLHSSISTLVLNILESIKTSIEMHFMSHSIGMTITSKSL